MIRLALSLLATGAATLLIVGLHRMGVRRSKRLDVVDVDAAREAGL